MTEQIHETDHTAAPELPAAFTKAQESNFLTLDQIMSSARRARRTARICLAAHLESDYLQAIDDLADLVGTDGKPVNQDASMGDVAAIGALNDKIADLHQQMADQTYSVLFEAMTDDEWQVFEKKHRGAEGKLKDPAAWQAEIIAACAINPTFTVEDVKAMRGRLGPTQIVELANQAFSACSTGGVDVPKLPSYFQGPKQPESSLS